MKIQRPLHIVSILFILSLVACNASMQPTVSTPTQTPTVTPTQTVRASPTKSPTDTATPADTATHVVEPLAGVIYQLHNQTTNQYQKINQSSLAQIGVDGVGHVILQGYNIQFSPDQKQAIYQSYDQKTYTQCIFFIDFVKKEGKMLVCRPGGFFNQILGWAANDTDTLYGVFPTLGGIVSTISLSDGVIQPIDSEHRIHIADDVKLSPDGQSIAYSSYDSKTRSRIGWLYSQQSGVVALSSKNYKTGAYPDISKPAWSPDNQKIAWVLQDNHLHGAIGVFDLTKKTAIVLHPSFALVASYLDGGAPPISPWPMWSPDGQWISADQWVIGANGHKEYRFDGNIIGWSPDSQWVLYGVEDKSQASISELRVAHFDGTHTFKLGFVNPSNNDTVLWSQDGQQFLFVDKDQKVQLVDTQTWKSHDMSSLFPFDAKSTNLSLLDWVQPISVSLEFMTILPTYQPVFQCPNALATRLKVGDHGRITSFSDGLTTSLRSAPEIGGNVLANLAKGTDEFDIVDGPVCYSPDRSHAYVYWKVMVPSVNKTGWLAEGDLNSYYLQPWPSTQPAKTSTLTPPATNSKGSPGTSKNGLTWGKAAHDSEFGMDLVSCHGRPRIDGTANGSDCDPYQGDTSCSVALPILCLKPENLPRPNYAVSGEPLYSGWAGGHIGLTQPILGTKLVGIEWANAMCVAALGSGYRMAEHHDGQYVLGMGKNQYYGDTWRSPQSVLHSGGWSWYAYGNLPGDTRFWVNINDQPGNCWSR